MKRRRTRAGRSQGDVLDDKGRRLAHDHNRARGARRLRWPLVELPPRSVSAVLISRRRGSLSDRDGATPALCSAICCSASASVAKLLIAVGAVPGIAASPQRIRLCRAEPGTPHRMRVGLWLGHCLK